ncbi:STAS domain-containing protein [Solirubrobacter soli]|uniref:STAS domain-containing protein n=1 Tax=Solirubrobacter soli TaxID=363832 RepID=UPI001FE15582|nr:sodium-independent anion transporter [Solirubrobacter soli]
MPVLGRQTGTGFFRELDEHPGDDTFEGVVTLRLDSGLFFATADALEERVRELTDGGTRALIVDFRGVNFIDSQGAERLTGILELMQSRGATLRLAQVRPHVLRVLRADGFVDRVGAAHIHDTLDLAMRAEQASEVDFDVRRPAP